jgi:hypothetical protein
MNAFTNSAAFAHYKTLKSSQYASRSHARDISERWVNRVMANGWDADGAPGAEAYVKKYGKGIGEAKMIALAIHAKNILLPNRQGATDFSERLWEIAFERFGENVSAGFTQDPVLTCFDEIPAALQPSTVYPPPPSYAAAVSCVVFANTKQVLAIDENHEPAQLTNDLSEALTITSSICPPFVILGELLPAKANRCPIFLITRALFSDYCEISATETDGNAKACNNLFAYITAALPDANPDVEVVLDLAA